MFFPVLRGVRNADRPRSCGEPVFLQLREERFVVDVERFRRVGLVAAAGVENALDVVVRTPVLRSTDSSRAGESQPRGLPAERVKHSFHRRWRRSFGFPDRPGSPVRQKRLASEKDTDCGEFIVSFAFISHAATGDRRSM